MDQSPLDKLRPLRKKPYFTVSEAERLGGGRASRTFGERYRLIHASVATFAGDRGMPTYHDRTCALCIDSVVYWGVV
jgi:hypothetical protein